MRSKLNSLCIISLQWTNFTSGRFIMDFFAVMTVKLKDNGDRLKNSWLYNCERIEYKCVNIFVSYSLVKSHPIKRVQLIFLNTYE